MSASGGSTSFRNFPDVAMVADDIAVFFGGQPRGRAGTSNSAPLWAGFVGLANQLGAKNGVGQVGFANPVHYAIGQTRNQPAPNLYSLTFNDIADGVSNGRFSSVAGYDLATGWGSPKCGLIQQLGGSSPLTFSGYTELEVRVSNGDDGIRDDSEASVDIFLSGVTAPTHFVFHPQNSTDGYGGNTQTALPYHLTTGGHPLSDFGRIDLKMVSHNDQFLETDDSWLLNGVNVTADRPGGPESCLVDLMGEPIFQFGNGTTQSLTPRSGCP
jgi:hypothetical protein